MAIENGSRPILRIYVGQHCGFCEEAMRLATEVKRKFAGLFVEIIDLDAEDSVNHDNVFSIPTYVFNGRTISLGNPTAEELFAKVSDVWFESYGVDSPGSILLEHTQEN